MYEVTEIVLSLLGKIISPGLRNCVDSVATVILGNTEQEDLNNNIWIIYILLIEYIVKKWIYTLFD